MRATHLPADFNTRRQEAILATGIIKRLVRDRGFGFIQPNGEAEDIFFHNSAVASGAFDSLNEGQQVEFEKERDPRDARRSRAGNVRVVG
jgi:CspA family cold shock protein